MKISIKYYRDKLGLKVTFEWNDPVDYTVLKRGEISIHLTKEDPEKCAPSANTSIYIFVHSVDAVHKEFLDKGVQISNPIADRDYGMRDFDIKDPDGHLLCFGKG